jgi:nitrous oxide reductase accessory protein NosL
MRWALLALLVIGCGQVDAVEEAAAAAPVSLDGTECAVCSMTVADQASPRAQVQHRGGEHRHFCSVADLVVYLNTPGPLGEPEAVWVEAMPADLDPAAHDTSPQDWVLAADATFAIAKDRRVMGTPVLAYGKDVPASAALTWTELRARLTP